MNEGLISFSTSLDDIGINPKTLPEGEYRLRILGGEQAPVIDVVEVQGEPKKVLRFNCEVMCLTDGNVKVETQDGVMEVKGMRVFETMFLDERSAHKVVRLAKACGLDTGGNNVSISELQGKEFDAIIKHRPNKNDPDQVFANIKTILLPE